MPTRSKIIVQTKDIEEACMFFMASDLSKAEELKTTPTVTLNVLYATYYARHLHAYYLISNWFRLGSSYEHSIAY